YEELISNCNDKEEIEEIQNAYEKLLGILNQSKNHSSDYKNCKNCNSKLNKNDIYCYKCGKNQHVKAKELNIKVKKAIIPIAALIVVFQILNFVGFIDSIGFGNSFARSPKEAVYNNFKSVDTN